MSMSSGPTTDLQKFTVAQLKALCKEKNLVGYSKLTKTAIIQKLVGNEGSIKVSSSQPAATSFISLRDGERLNDTVVQPGADHEKRNTQSKITNHTVDISPKNLDPLTPTVEQRSNDAGSQIGCDAQASLANIVPTSSRVIGSLGSSGKRPREPSELLHTSSKKQKHTTTSTWSNFQNVTDTLSPMKTPTTQVAQKMTSDLQIQPENTTLNVSGIIKTAGLVVPLSAKNPQGDQIAPMTILKSKRFIPLTVQKSGNALRKYLPAIDSSASSSRRKEAPFVTSLQSLEFTNSTPLLLQPVSYPPSLSQRKNVSNLALFLSAVSPKDLDSCVRVSRLFRYAGRLSFHRELKFTARLFISYYLVYISAFHRLRRDFFGRRLELDLQQYSYNMTNMWPYLQQREREVSMRKRVYRESFLNHALKGQDKISSHLWTSPDNPKQITIAIRFLLTQLYFSKSITNPTSIQFESKITDTQEIVPDELWTITVSSAKFTGIYYVLEATCEVIGRPPLQSSISLEGTSPGTLPIRADWSAYIHSSLSSSNISLTSRLKWINHEEYDRGISKIWLKRMRDEGEPGEAKIVVAKRYTLACVVANSVSGPWMSSTDMAQEFNGMSACVSRAAQKMHLHLFLPAHHHVESLHFTTAKGEPLHPALAVVQTPSREYYILRDNGMQVGCEEDGIAEVWMRILGCDVCGQPIVPS